MSGATNPAFEGDVATSSSNGPSRSFQSSPKPGSGVKEPRRHSLAATISALIVPKTAEDRRHSHATDGTARDNRKGSNASGGDRKNSVSPKPGVKSALKTSSSFPQPSARRPSVADVALSLHMPSRSHGGYEGPLFERDTEKNLFIHPFGNAGNVIEEMLLDQSTAFRARRKGGIDTEKETPSTAPAYLVVWLVFTFLMVGIAAAIIFGAGENDRDPGIISRIHQA